MLVGAYTDKPLVMALGPNNHVAHQAAPLSALQNQLANIKNSYKKQLEVASMSLPSLIPLSLIFSLSFTAAERKEIIKWLGHNGKEFRLIQVSNPASSYLYYLDSKEGYKNENFVVLESLDDAVQLSYHFLKDDKREERYLSMPELGWKAGRAKIMAYLIEQLKQNGLQLDQQGLEILQDSILRYSGNKVFRISKESKEISIKAKIRLPSEKFNDLLLRNRSIIKSFFQKEEVKHLNIYNVILMGSYFNNSVLQDYFSQQPELGNLTIRKKMDDEQALAAAVAGALLKTKDLLDAEKFRQLKAQEAQLITRNHLLAEIKELCTEGSKIEQYKLSFFPRAESLGIPREIALWHIKEKLQKVSIAHQLMAFEPAPTTVKSKETPSRQKSVLPSVPAEAVLSKPLAEANVDVLNEVDSSEGLDHSIATPQTDTEDGSNAEQALRELGQKAFSTPSNQVAEVEATPALTAVTSTKQADSKARHYPVLLSYFTIDRIYANAPFLYFKGRMKGDKVLKVVRFISTDELADSQLALRFRQLYDWEASYYDDLSTLFTTENGKYYYRNFIEGKQLADYIVENEIDKKQTIAALSSQELQLLQLIWEEINGLKFACKNLNQDNFIVTAKLKWNLQKELGISIVDFPAEEGTKEQMYASVHAMLETLLRENVYSEFIEKFKL